MRKAISAALLASSLLCSPANAQAIIGSGITGDIKVSGGGGGCAQATAWLSGKTTTFSAAYTTMICGMVTDGDFANLGRLYIHATDNTTNALTDIVSNAPATISGTATFTANSGYVPGTGLFDTGLNYSTFFTSSNGALLAWTTGGATNDNGCPIGEITTAYDIYMQVFDFGSSTTAALNSVTVGGTTTNATGLFAADLSGTTLTAFKNGSSIGSATGTGATPSNTNAQAWSCAGSGSNYNENVAMVGVAKSLGSAGQLRVYNRIHTFLHTVNASLFP